MARGQRLQLGTWISHLSGGHLNRQSARTCGYGTKYRMVSLNHSYDDSKPTTYLHIGMYTYTNTTPTTAQFL